MTFYAARKRGVIDVPMAASVANAFFTTAPGIVSLPSRIDAIRPLREGLFCAARVRLTANSFFDLIDPRFVARPAAIRLPRSQASNIVVLVKKPSKNTADSPLYQLKITLKWTKPPIWRRVVVRGDMTLDRLHQVIQIAMGWDDDHMHQFVVGSGFDRVSYGRPEPQFAGFGTRRLDARRYSVSDLAPAAKRKFYYEYDFGDGWLHEVVAEKILPPDPAFKHPVCLAGARACPPEDCGGVGGFYNLLSIAADPKDPDHEEMRDWIGEDYDPEQFSAVEANRSLARLEA